MDAESVTPGQGQHDCLNDIPEYFFRNNYNVLMKSLWLADFITVNDQSLNLLSPNAPAGGSFFFFFTTLLKILNIYFQKLWMCYTILTGKNSANWWHEPFLPKQNTISQEALALAPRENGLMLLQELTSKNDF